MKRLLLAAVAATATGASLAAVTLVPTLVTPAELQLEEYEVYQLSIRNSGNTNATGVQIRLNLPPGMTAMGPWPSICSQIGHEFVCNTGSVPARATRSYAIVFKAPAAPQTFSHRLAATATAAAPATSVPRLTTYQHFDIPVTGSSTDPWEIRSCGGGTNGIAYNLCPTSSEVVGDALLHAGGTMQDLLYGQTGSWLQTGPHGLRLDTPAVPGYQDAWFSETTVINSKCFRGAGQTVPTVQGQLPFRTANKICRK